MTATARSILAALSLVAFEVATPISGARAQNGGHVAVQTQPANPFTVQAPSANRAAAQAPSASRVAPEQKPTPEQVVKAAERTDSATLEALLAAGGAVGDPTPRGETPLQAAAARGNRENIALLLRHGAPIDSAGLRGITALGSATRNGQGDVIRQLLDAGADPDAAADVEHAPMVLALTHGNTPAIELLFAHGSKVAEKPELAAAVLAGFSDADDEAVCEAVAPHLVAIVQNSPLARQAAADAIATSGDAVSAILQRHFDAVTRDAAFQTMLLVAAAGRGRFDLAKSALAHGADINALNSNAGSPLAAAVKFGDARMISMLVSAGADLERAGVEAASLPSPAVNAAEERKASRLLARVHALDARDAGGRTLLFRAAERGDAERVVDLLQLGANPAVTVRRWPGDDGWTALMAAAAEGETAIVARLLAAGAAVDQRNADGRTALAFAAWYGRSPVASCLMTAGADPSAADNHGLTPIQLADAMGDAAIKKVLRSARPAALPPEDAAANAARGAAPASAP